MLGKTHVTLGIASALVITHPASVPNIVTAIVGGALGGWIVDIDIRDQEAKKDRLETREAIYEGILYALFIGAFLALDFVLGKGMCRYIIDNWGGRVSGALLCLIALCLIGLNTSHRTFTHSFLSMALFSGAMFYFCRPVTVPFAIGYLSHLLSDFLNMRGEQLFFPLKWRFCLKLCASDGTVNRILFWCTLALSVVSGAFLFSGAMNGSLDTADFLSLLRNRNILRTYLIFINIITFRRFQRRWKPSFRKAASGHSKKAELKLEYESWFLNFLVVIGGGVGMLLSMVLRLSYPAAYNGNWWTFCYAGILSWATIYCYTYNPFGLVQHEIVWSSAACISLALYLLAINCVSAFYLFSIRKKRFDEHDSKHTLILLFGALGGTVGAILMAFGTHHEGKYAYVTRGFFLMLFSQIVFINYMVSIL